MNKVSLLSFESFQTVLAMMELCYRGMVNCKIRQNKELVMNSQLLRKEDKTNRIIAKMRSQDCTEEQIKEVLIYFTEQFLILIPHTIFVQI